MANQLLLGESMGLMQQLERLSVSQRLFSLVGGGTATVLGLTGLCLHGVDAMYQAALSHPGDMAVLEVLRGDLFWQACVTAVVGLLLVLPSFWLVTRSIVARLHEAQQVLERVAQGDLTGRINHSGADEVAQLLRGISAMQTALTGVIGEVRGCTDSIHVAAGEIAAGNLDLSNRTEAQAASLQHTNADLQQLNRLLQDNVQASDVASQQAGLASGQAGEGSTAVTQVVSRMQSISDHSSRMAEIVGVIDAIAFQTNVLAINASVEASRAGEQGRGFAVVASEVRVLAQRSADAAREIKHLIDTSLAEVRQGVKDAEGAGQAMRLVLEAVRGSAKSINEVSAATAHQAEALDRVRSEVERMEEVTQRNAALVEQATAAAQSLREQSEGLVRSVATFKIASHT